MTGGTRAVLRLRCRDSGEAERARRSLAVDDADAGHAGLRVEGVVLVIEADCATALGLLRTLDDLLGCLRAGEPEL